MARKVLLSFLGKTDYTPVYYTYMGRADGEKETDHRTKFIQEALATRLCKDLGPEDCIMVFRTEGSNTNNWIDTQDEEGNLKPGLERTLNSIPGLKCRINPEKDSTADTYLIKEGLDEEQMWDIFNCVFEKLEPGDEIYFDVTHAFRTIPMFAMALFNYAGFLKNTEVKGVYYGAFEQISELSEIRKIKDEKEKDARLEKVRVPIVDFTNLVRLQEINTAAAGFRDFGSLNAFSKLITKSGDPTLNKAVRDIAQALKNLDDYIQTSQIESIYGGEYMKTISARINEFRDSEHTNEAQCALLDEIRKTLEEYGFVAEASDSNTEAAIKWAERNRLIQQAYTMAQEYLITRVLDLLENEGLTEDLKREIRNSKKGRLHIDHELRKAIGTIIQNADGDNYSSTGRMLVDIYPSIMDLSPLYRTLCYKRNELAHAGTTANAAREYEYYEKIFKNTWKECLDLLEELY